MANLENLEAKIRADSEQKAEEILAAARSQAEESLASAEAGARAEAERLLAEAQREAVHISAQIVSAKTLAMRDLALTAKRGVLDRIFGEALERLNSMPEAEFKNYVAEYLSRIDTDGEELVLPEKYGVKDIGWLNDRLKAAGKKGNLILAECGGAGGFILRKNGIEHNHTFAALLGYYRQDLESEVLKILYA